MTRYLLSITLTLFAICAFSQNENEPHFFVSCSSEGAIAVQYTDQFEQTIATHLKNAFTCSRVKTNAELKEAIGREKVRQLKGVGSPEMRSFCDDLDCDYLVALRLLDYTETQVSATASCIKYRGKIQTMKRETLFGSNSAAGIKKLLDDVAKSLVDQLKVYEICPFTGRVDITITSQRDTSGKEDYYVYCNQIDQMYHREISLFKKSVATWQLEKIALNKGKGTVHFSLNELNTYEELNPCHTCGVGPKQGMLTTKETITKNGSGEGVSKESVFGGKPIDDIRFDIAFNPDSTYVLEVKAASKQGKFFQKTEKSAEGICDNMRPQKDTVSIKFTIPLPGKYGPYKGSSLSKVLTEDVSFPYIDPISGEKQDIILKFHLERH